MNLIAFEFGNVLLVKSTEIGMQCMAQFPATKDVNMYFLPQKASNQLKLTLKVASAFKK